MTLQKRFLGKYRGTVMNTVDPLNLGRIQAAVPDVTGSAMTSWATPCFPVTGMFMVPIVGANVWIEFEKGDPDYPIWTGCFYGTAADVRVMAVASPPGPPAITMQTPLQNGLTISDSPGSSGGIIVRSASGASVIVNDTGIHIDNGKGASISLVGPSVSINNDALRVD